MGRFVLIFFLLFILYPVYGQRVLSPSEAVELAVRNSRNLQPSRLFLQQQKELMGASVGLENPQIFVEAPPYESLVAGLQQNFDLPAVYKNRKNLQKEKIRYAELQLQGSELELKRDVRLAYVQLQFLQAKFRLLRYKDSIYQEIREAALRFFAAGQINKLEETQAVTQADQARNELLRSAEDIASENTYFSFLLGYTDSFSVSSFGPPVYELTGDTLAATVRQQLLEQEIVIAERELRAQRSELLPSFQAGISFPTTSVYERPVGYQLGVSIPLWGKQNRARLEAARTSVEISRAVRDLEMNRLQAEYSKALLQYRREASNLVYFEQQAIPQATGIREIAQRLFHGGELNYIESLRNLDFSFGIFFDRLDAQRSYEEARIRLSYLNGTL